MGAVSAVQWDAPIALPLKTPRKCSEALVALAWTSVFLSVVAVAPVRAGDQATAVFARVSDDYARARQADGSPAAEYFAFAEGGRWTGSTRDPSLEELKFIDVARVVAGPLRDRNYLPTRDPAATKLLIVVYWGRTRALGSTEDSESVRKLVDASAQLASSKSLEAQRVAAAPANSSLNGPGMVCGRIQTVADGQVLTDRISSENSATSAMALVSAENSQRDQLDAQNAAMLGFDTELRETSGLEGTALGHRHGELVGEIEEQRYFVVLMAYDFQLMWKEKKHKLLWETRYSVPERGRGFDTYLLAMSREASRYFGARSRGIEHLDLPEGRVDVGDVKSLGVVMAK